MDGITLEEAAEIIAVDLASDSYDARNRLNDPSDILSICSTLLILRPAYAPSPWSNARYHPNEQERYWLSFSHLSVKEYLESDRAPPSFRITHDAANAMIARISLVILLYAEFSSPFFGYARLYWLMHAEKLYIGLEPLVQRLFDDSNIDRFWIWTSRSCHPDPLASVTDSCQVPSWVNTAAERLYLASHLGFPSICRTLIANGANVNDLDTGPPLVAACLGGHKAVIELLLDHGADPDPKPLANQALHTPLSAACRFGDPALVQFLLEKIVDINVKTLRLALIEAVRSGAVQIVNLILERGAELNFRFGQLVDMVFDTSTWPCYTVTPLLLAIRKDHEQVVQLLVKNGADVNYEGGVGEFPLALAVEWKNEKIVKLLLQHGADINRGWEGWDNVLERAIGGDPEEESIIGVLLAHVSRLDVENSCYDSAYTRALRYCSESVIRLFESAGFPKRDRGGRMNKSSESHSVILAST
jgi:ankyrin repeat protein